MKNSTNYEVQKFENEEGFTNGWYVLEVGEDRHVIWQSEAFATEEEAKTERRNQIGETLKVNKADYEVYKFMSGYYGIVKIGNHGACPVWGGDSADEDCYDVQIANNVYEAWDGELTYCGQYKYGEEGYTI